MAKTSAGFLMFRKTSGKTEVLLAHMGGPFYAKKDEGFWSIPKGEIADGENLLGAAEREFEEETGLKPAEPIIPLGIVKYKSGKEVHAWAFEGDCDPSKIRSNTFKMEWPPKSGVMREFEENDRTEFFDIETARKKLIHFQVELLDRLESHLNQAQ